MPARPTVQVRPEGLRCTAERVGAGAARKELCAQCELIGSIGVVCGTDLALAEVRAGASEQKHSEHRIARRIVAQIRWKRLERPATHRYSGIGTAFVRPNRMAG